MTQQVDHIKQAERCLYEIDRNPSHPLPGMNRRALAEALIAIAQQLQIANLIAVSDCSANDPAIIKRIGLETE